MIRCWGEQTADWPGDDDTVEEWAIELDGEIVGFVQFAEEPDEDYRHADVDILLATRASTGRASAPTRCARSPRHLIEDRGHHRITLDDVAAQRRARSASTRRLGFRRVGITRLSERGADGTWHDELLMELVVEPRGRGP